MKELLILLLTCYAISGFAQTDPKTAKKLEKAEKLEKDQEYDAAEKIYLSLLKEYPNSSYIWNEYAQCAYERYYVSRQRSRVIYLNPSKNQDQQFAQLVAALSSAGITEGHRANFIRICREATLKSESEMASVYLRDVFFDLPVDTAVSDSAKREFNAGERFFQRKDYTQAITHYSNAAAIDSHYYKAKLYIGDSYYMLADYVTAGKYFRKAIEEQPALIEPRKFLVDALERMKAYEEAYEETIKALLLYPDAGMFMRLDQIAAKKNKTFNKLWIPREVLPNQTRTTSYKNKVWKYYVDAKNDFDTSYYDRKTGIIKPNPVTTHKYLEVYAWEQLLKNAPADQFTEARQMQEKGYLDCYVLFSLYHVDVLNQYLDLSKSNRDRLRSYIELLMK